MKNENGWLNCPIYCLLLENIVCAPFFEKCPKNQNQNKPIKSKTCKEKSRTFRRTKKPENHLPKQNTKNLMDEKFQKSTRL
jgi:hypothetical protein